MKQNYRAGSMFETILNKARTMTDAELLAEYSWVNGQHMARILSEVRAHIAAS